MTPLRCLAAATLLLGLGPARASADEPAHSVSSPDGRWEVSVRLDDRARATFALEGPGGPIASGVLGMAFAGSAPLGEGLAVRAARRSTVDESYAIAVGKASSARDRHEGLIVSFQESAPPARHFDVEFRAFDDGVAFRYRFPRPDGLGPYVVVDELTRLSFDGDPTARVLPLGKFTTSYEQYYESMPVSKIGPDRLIGLPMLLERPEHPWVALAEAGLSDFAGMYVSGSGERPGQLSARLSPLPGRPDGAKVVGEGSFETPWRVLMLADDPGRFLESNLIFHLNAPCAIADTSWIRPGKTTFPWWNGYAPEKGLGFKPGVDTSTMKHYIDFCAENGIPYHSLDGLDIAWYGGPIQPEGAVDLTRSAPSIDMPELLRYAREKGVRLRLWMHWKPLKDQIDAAFATYERWGIEGVMVDFMDRDDQEMVRFYGEMARKAADHHLTLTLHGAYKPTGMERTWPNVLTSEAVLNQEYNKWPDNGSRGTPTGHNLDAAFVRMIAGPLDYHQGGMRNVLAADYRPRSTLPTVQGTRGHQLAMYVVYENHLPMMADTPEAYRGQPGLDFLAQVPCNWDETKVLRAEPGQCLIVARRKGTTWYLGGMTASKPRNLMLPLDFLPPGRFDARVHLDDPAQGPTALTTRTQGLTRGESLLATMPAEGGFVAVLTPSSR